MIWQEEVSIIAAMNNFDVEDEAQPYWPRSRTKGVYRSPIQVTLAKRLRSEFFISRHFILTNEEGARREVRQVQFTKWVDDATVRPAELVSFLLNLRSGITVDGLNTVVVHCSNGSSRTAVVLGLWLLQLKAELSDELTDVMEVVRHLNKFRCGMLDSEAKIEILVRSFSYYLKHAKILPSRGIALNAVENEDSLSLVSISSEDDGYETMRFRNCSNKRNTYEDVRPLVSQVQITEGQRPVISVASSKKRSSRGYESFERQGPRCSYAQPSESVTIPLIHAKNSARDSPQIRRTTVVERCSEDIVENNVFSPMTASEVNDRTTISSGTSKIELLPGKISPTVEPKRTKFSDGSPHKISSELNVEKIPTKISDLKAPPSECVRIHSSKITEPSTWDSTKAKTSHDFESIARPSHATEVLDISEDKNGIIRSRIPISMKKRPLPYINKRNIRTSIRSGRETIG
ncbi:receptor-type tyrosine-protein phosphatase S [Hyalella azteca]|uniref:protein-tyrosine-phosphatase n=1 Tax=Hyalella azteca TaxID=294128 RepID=A0A8B7MZL8_HYAAZ|nr:receptor-type tyrosine-protein phosphatase S [Hyalella azteca]